MGWGGPAGGGFGPGSVQTSAAAGLPFAGVPEELRERAEKLLANEPAHVTPIVRFRQRTEDRRPFTLRRFLGAHRFALGGTALLLVIETLSTQVGGVLTQRGIDDGVLKHHRSVLIGVAVAYVVSVLVSTFVGSWRVAATGRLGERLMYELRLRIFSHLQRLSLDFYTEEKAGRVMTRMTSDVDALSQLFQDGIVNLAVQALTMLVVTVILFRIQPTLALITILVIVPPMLMLTLWFRSASDKGYGVVRERIADLLADLSESLSGIRIVTAFNRRRHNVVNHRNIVGQYRDANVATAKVNAIYGPATDLVGAGAQILVLVVGGHMVLRHQLTIGQLAAVVLYLTSFFAPIQQLVQLYGTYQSGQAAVAKIRDLLGTEPSVAEAIDATDLPPIDGRIELVDVTFGYDPALPVLRHVSLVIEPGETLAVVGPTGAGKSTVAKLVTRFYDPTAGAVLIDGHDLRGVTLASLRRQLGVVPQEPFLFAGTIRHNVTFARPDAAVRRCSPPAWRSASATCSSDCRTGSTPSCTSAACRSALASASCSRWPGRSSPARACSCWTRRPATSTCRARAWSSERSMSCSRVARRSSSRIAWPRPCAPIASP